MGCKERVKRQCLQQHIEANVVQHQLMMCEAFKNVKKENEILKQALKSAQNRINHSINGLVLKMAEEVTDDSWKEYFLSLRTVSTNVPNPICPVIIKWSDYNEIKQIAKDSDASFKKHYYTWPFYTHSGGYKIQVRIYPHGNSKTSSHVSLFFYIMRGENNDDLRWPFDGTLMITLLNQLENSDHLTRSIEFLDSEKYREFIKKPDPGKTRNDSGWGFSEFISLSEVESSTAYKQYLMNDTLYFMISATIK